MGFERERYQLEPLKLKESSTACALVHEPSGKVLQFKRAYLPLLKQIKSSHSIEDIILGMGANQTDFRIGRLLYVLRLLAEENLIRSSDQFFKSLYDVQSGQSEFKREFPFLKSPFFKWDFTQFKATDPGSGGFSVLAGLLFVLGALTAIEFRMPLDMGIRPSTLPSGPFVVLAFWGLHSFVLLLTGIIEIFIYEHFVGGRPKSSIHFSPFGTYLHIDRWLSYNTKNEHLSALTVFSLLLLRVTGFLYCAQYLNFTDSEMNFLNIALFLAVLTESNALSRTQLSEAMHILFHSQNWPNRLRTHFDSFFYVFVVAWMSAASIYLFKLLRPILTPRLVNELTPNVAFSFLLVLFFIATVAIEIFKSLEYLIGDTRLEAIFKNSKTKSPPNRTVTENTSSLSEIFSKVGLLREVPDKLRNILQAHSGFLEFSPGETICLQGDMERSLFIVLEGEASIFKSQYSGERFVGSLKPGSIFGEYGLFLGAPRTASVRAATKIRVLRVGMSMEQWKTTIEREKFEFVKERVWLYQALSVSKVFQGIPFEILDEIVGTGKIGDIDSGGIIFSEGDPGDKLFLVIEGFVDVSIQGNKVRTLKRGDVFGELALFHQIKRTATITANTDVMVFAIERKYFWKLLSTNLPLALALDRLREAYV